MRIKIVNCDYVINWEKYEEKIGMKIPNSYKEMYEKYGSISLDSFIYFSNIVETNSIMGLEECVRKTKYAYSELKDYLDSEEQEISIGDKQSEWFPVGINRNGDYVLVNDDKGVMVIDGSFLERDVYQLSLLEFIESYLKNEMEYGVLPEDLKCEEHELTILAKE